MACILSLNSHVVYGHVGGQAAVPAWHLLGHEVCHLPTVIFSNHPGHGGYEGDAVDIGLQNRLLDGLLERRLLAACRALHTGYLGQAGSVDVALRAIAALPQAIVLCDPVLGDHDRLYVGADVAEAIRDRLLPGAGMITPNRFELAWLTGRRIDTSDDAVAAARALQQRGPDIVVCTGAALQDGMLCNLAVTPDGIFQVKVPYIADRDIVPKGTGDAFAAILLGHYLDHGDVAAALAWASSALHGLIQASIESGADELAVIAAQGQIAAPGRQFDVERLA